MANLDFDSHTATEADRMGLLDPRMRKDLKTAVKSYIGILIVLMVAHWTVGSIYYGANHKRTVNIHNTDIKIIDLDHSHVGGNLTAIFSQIPQSAEIPSIVEHKGIATLGQAEDFIRRDGWGAIVINSGATERLQRALALGAKYDPQDALTLLISTGRAPLATMIYIQTALNEYASIAAHKYAVGSLQALKQRRQLGMLARANVVAVVSPIGARQIDVAPFTFAVSIVSTTFLFFVSLVGVLGPLLSWRMSMFGVMHRTRYRDAAVFWIGLICCWLLVFSLYAALAFLAMKSPTYSRGGEGLEISAGRFFAVWFTVYGATLGPALWIFAWYINVPPALLGVVSMLTIIPNVASTIIPIEYAPAFFRWFEALPFYNATVLFRYIVSGANGHVGRNVGVLVGEVAFDVCLLVCSLWLNQTLILLGVTDRVGNLRGSPFFDTHIPYYKDVARAGVAHVELSAGSCGVPKDEKDEYTDIVSKID